MPIRQRAKVSITQPLFGAGLFTKTSVDRPSEKAQFANTLLRFIQDDFPLSTFTVPFYIRLNQMFGIYHQTRIEFWDEYFQDTAGKTKFLDYLVHWPSVGKPSETWSDVEVIVKERLIAAGVLDVWAERLFVETNRLAGR